MLTRVVLNIFLSTIQSHFYKSTIKYFGKTKHSTSEDNPAEEKKVMKELTSIQTMKYILENEDNIKKKKYTPINEKRLKEFQAMASAFENEFTLLLRTAKNKFDQLCANTSDADEIKEIYNDLLRSIEKEIDA